MQRQSWQLDQASVKTLGIEMIWGHFIYSTPTLRANTFVKALSARLCEPALEIAMSCSSHFVGVIVGLAEGEEDGTLAVLIGRCLCAWGRKKEALPACSLPSI